MKILLHIQLRKCKGQAIVSEVLENPIIKRMALSIHRPSVATPDGSSGLSVVEFFTEQLKTSKSNVVLAPPSFELSGDPSKKLGEEAEKKVIDAIEKCGRDIPGIQIICFHGVRVIGGSPSLIREVDQICFITYQGRRYVFITEVKCNADIKTSGQTRKKAIDQVNTFTKMLRNELNVPTCGLQTHSVWPNMEPTEPCGSCKGRHDSLYEKPKACRQKGTQPRSNPEVVSFWFDYTRTRSTSSLVLDYTLSIVYKRQAIRDMTN